MRTLHCLCLVWLFCLPLTTTAHDGPDPVCHWTFNEKQIDGQKLKARLGPDGTFSEAPRIVPDPWGQSAYFHGRQMECLLATDHRAVQSFLPTKDFTVSAWVVIDQPEEWGGFAGVIQDNGDAESGWILGYNQDVFT
ncbi:MAG: hypothetical protein ACK557_03085, partial [Planctomycetota bacterium]